MAPSLFADDDLLSLVISPLWSLLVGISGWSRLSTFPQASRIRQPGTRPLWLVDGIGRCQAWGASRGQAGWRLKLELEAKVRDVLFGTASFLLLCDQSPNLHLDQLDALSQRRSEAAAEGEGGGRRRFGAWLHLSHASPC